MLKFCSMVAPLLWELRFLIAAGAAVSLLLLRGDSGEVCFSGRFVSFGLLLWVGLSSFSAIGGRWIVPAVGFVSGLPAATTVEFVPVVSLLVDDGGRRGWPLQHSCCCLFFVFLCRASVLSQFVEQEGGWRVKSERSTADVLFSRISCSLPFGVHLSICFGLPGGWKIRGAEWRPWRQFRGFVWRLKMTCGDLVVICVLLRVISAKQRCTTLTLI